jgi:hypothetical protein
MSNIGNSISKYFISGLLIVLGLMLLFLSSGQTILFKMGGLAILVVGVLGVLYIKKLINRKVQIGVAAIVAIGAIVFAWLNYSVINDQLIYAKKKERIEGHVIQRMKDIRKAQLAYVKEKGEYASSFDSLLYFLKNGELTLIKRLGSLPDTVPTEEMARELGLLNKMPAGMTDEEVIQSGIIVRDTFQVAVLENVFNEADMKSRKTAFYVDSLPFVPFGGHRFEMNAGTIDAGGVTVPVFEVIDPKPFADQFKLGSMTEASTSGNWNE